MPTTVTHAVLAGLAAKAFGERERPLRLWAAAIIVSVLPDADVLGFSFGVQYGDFLGHRGFFHSPFFCLLVSIVCAAALFRHHRPSSGKWLKYVAFLFLLGAGHGVLDAFTNGGLGVALLAPFVNTRYFFPWTPIPAAPIGMHRSLTGLGLHVVIWEIKHIWVPVFLALVGFLVVRRRRRRKRDRCERA